MVKKNRTIGANPLTDYLTTGAKKTKSKQKYVEYEEPVRAPQKTRVTIHVSVDLIDRVKNAVYWEPGLTLTGFAEKAFEKELKKMEREWGEAYPERDEKKLKGGRPLK